MADEGPEHKADEKLQDRSEDAAVPPGSFVSTMATPGAISGNAVQAAAISAQPVKVVRIARAASK